MSQRLPGTAETPKPPKSSHPDREAGDAPSADRALLWRMIVLIAVLATCIAIVAMGQPLQEFVYVLLALPPLLVLLTPRGVFGKSQRASRR